MTSLLRTRNRSNLNLWSRLMKVTTNLWSMIKNLLTVMKKSGEMRRKCLSTFSDGLKRLVMTPRPRNWQS